MMAYTVLRVGREEEATLEMAVSQSEGMVWRLVSPTHRVRFEMTRQMFNGNRKGHDVLNQLSRAAEPPIVPHGIEVMLPFYLDDQVFGRIWLLVHPRMPRPLPETDAYRLEITYRDEEPGPSGEKEACFPVIINENERQRLADLLYHYFL